MKLIAFSSVLSVVALCAALSFGQVGQGPSAPELVPNQSQMPTANESQSRELAASNTIEKGVPLKTALSIFDDGGFGPSAGWAWGSSEPDSKFTWRKISDGVEVVIYYSDKSQILTGISMIYVPPRSERRGNYRIVPVNRLAINPDGSYTVTFSKPAPKRKFETPQSKTPASSLPGQK